MTIPGAAVAFTQFGSIFAFHHCKHHSSEPICPLPVSREPFQYRRSHCIFDRDSLRSLHHIDTPTIGKQVQSR